MNICININDRNDKFVRDISRTIAKNRHFYKRSTFNLSIKTFRLIKLNINKKMG